MLAPLFFLADSGSIAKNNAFPAQVVLWNISDNLCKDCIKNIHCSFYDGIKFSIQKPSFFTYFHDYQDIFKKSHVFPLKKSHAFRKFFP